MAKDKAAKDSGKKKGKAVEEEVKSKKKGKAEPEPKAKAKKKAEPEDTKGKKKKGKTSLDDDDADFDFGSSKPGKSKKSKGGDDDDVRITDSDVLDLTEEQWDAAVAQKEYGMGGGMPPAGLYFGTVIKTEVEIGTGTNTKGAKVYKLTLKGDGETVDGEKKKEVIAITRVYATAGGSGGVLKMMEVAGLYKPGELKPGKKNKKPVRLPQPDKVTGSKVMFQVTHYKYEGKDRYNVGFDVPKKPEGKKGKKNKDFDL